MYIPNINKNENQAEIEDFLRKNSFGILVNQINQQLWATHIPMELDENAVGKLALFGHVAKENLQWTGFEQGTEVLAIFSGPHAYISSSWYDFENVPTWDYVAVHVYGKIRILNESELLKTLEKLVDKYEANSSKPVSLAGLSKKTMMQMRGIIGFEIEITDIHAKKKLSQQRDSINLQNIISELEKTGESGALKVADEMKKCPR